MYSSINEKKILELKPIVAKMAREFLAKCKAEGIDILITSGFRSFAEQDKLYAQGRTTPGAIVTNAKAGYSMHNYGLAFDCVPLIGGKPLWTSPYTKTSKIGKSCGLEWGGDWKSFKDMPHFQYLGGLTEGQIYKNKGSDIDWSKFNDNTQIGK